MPNEQDQERSLSRGNGGEVTIVLPVPANEGELGRLSPRLDSLKGKVIGLTNDGFWSLDVIYGQFRPILLEQYGVGGFLEKRKPSRTDRLAAEAFEEISTRCDAVISALGN